jgi:hypothetical protein
VLFTPLSQGIIVVANSSGGGLFDERPTTQRVWDVFVFPRLVDAKNVYSAFQLITAALAVGGLIIVGLIVGSLLQRERARELLAVIRRAVKQDESQ